MFFDLLESGLEGCADLAERHASSHFDLKHLVKRRVGLGHIHQDSDRRFLGFLDRRAAGEGLRKLVLCIYPCEY
jgi:hypothetical protein